MKANFITLFATWLLLTNCNNTSLNPQVENTGQIENKVVLPEKIPVLNFATFHFSFTPDGHTVEFDEKNKENQKKAHSIAAQLAEFKPTVIVVEIPPEYTESTQEIYSDYRKNPSQFANPSEIELIAYEVGRLAGADRIYGIDHKMNYNYRIGSDINNTIDSATYNQFEANPFESFPTIARNENNMDLIDKLKLNNSDKYLDFMITANADILTHAGTSENFEGADEAASFYERNLRMYSNFNRIPLTKDDRVFIIMGSAHTAFFRDFFSRSPKYEMVNTFEYLK
jgi:hypothetical protein